MGAKNDVIHAKSKGFGDPLTWFFVVMWLTMLATLILVGMQSFLLGKSMAQVAVVDCPVQPDEHRRIDAAQA